MTGIRASAIFRPEAQFGDGGTGDWYRFPTGLNIDFTPSNNVQEYREIGSKFVDNMVGGMFSGSGNVKFKFDYQCINILGWLFEDYAYANGTHTFKKSNGKRVKSMAIRTKELDRMVGGTHDATVVLKGCVPTRVTFSQPARNATIDVTVSFDFCDMEHDLTNLTSTDWDAYYEDDSSCVPAEWSCLNIGDTPIAYTESATFTVSNSASMMKGCGTRFNQNYQEGSTQISLSTQCYSYEPTVYDTRMYSGGVNNTETAPRAKGLKPIPLMKLKSGLTEGSTNYSLVIQLTKVMVDSMGQKNYTPDGKIMDNPTLKVTNFQIDIVNATTSAITIWN